MASEPVRLDPVAPDLTPWLRAGDGVVVGQACAEAVPLVDALCAQASAAGGVEVFCGPTWRRALVDAAAAPGSGLRITSYGALGELRRLASLRVVPCAMSAIPALLRAGELPSDVVLVQVAPPGPDGRCSLGVGVDYLLDAVATARTVIAEVNDRCPRTAGGSVPWERIDAYLPSSRPLLEAPPGTPGEIERRIAEHVAALVRDGDTLQLGVGALPNAIMGALHGHRDLGLHSGMITDGALALIDAGVMTGAEKSVDRGLAVAGAALGSRRLFAGLDGREDVELRPVSYTHGAATLAAVHRLVAINAALEVDLSGQVGAEAIAARRLGAVGGQADFLRAAAAGGGTGVVALPAERIVPSLSGPVSTARCDVDWVVTEHGARRLRALSDDERRRALLELAGARADALALA